MYEGLAKIGGFVGFFGFFNLAFRKCHSKVWQRSMIHYFPKNRLAARDLKRKRRELKKRTRKEKGCCGGPFHCCVRTKADKEEVQYLSKEAYMDSKEFHRMFSYQQFYRMAEDLERLRRLPEVRSMMQNNRAHFVESDPDFDSSGSGSPDIENQTRTALKPLSNH